jgi:hypothetical protein
MLTIISLHSSEQLFDRENDLDNESWIFDIVEEVAVRQDTESQRFAHNSYPKRIADGAVRVVTR